ncbi:MAG TPA: S8 family serine peptidase [Gemmatimonadaceae bacterium]|nr:S8 family serine peptidase [Gemmatimonadaceae bacterium]
MRYRLSDPPFAGRTGRGVTIAVLDSGIHAEHPHLDGATVLAGKSFANESDDAIDRIGHGTAVAAAIHEKAPHAQLIPVKLFHRYLTTNAETLALAIEWAAAAGANIINLSLGTANASHRERLIAAIGLAAEHGALVVAPCETEGTTLLPGSLDGVVGVLGDAQCDRDEINLERQQGGGLSAATSIFPRPIPDVPRERNLSGISFAVANATGFVARGLEGHVLREFLVAL